MFSDFKYIYLWYDREIHNPEINMLSSYSVIGGTYPVYMQFSTLLVFYLEYCISTLYCTVYKQILGWGGGGKGL